MITPSERAWLDQFVEDERDEIVGALTLVEKFPGTAKFMPEQRALAHLVEIIDALEASTGATAKDALSAAAQASPPARQGD